jgi:hypothetical protein
LGNDEQKHQEVLSSLVMKPKLHTRILASKGGDDGSRGRGGRKTRGRWASRPSWRKEVLMITIWVIAIRMK